MFTFEALDYRNTATLLKQMLPFHFDLTSLIFTITYTYNQFVVRCLIILEIFEILHTSILFSMSDADESDILCVSQFP